MNDRSPLNRKKGLRIWHIFMLLVPFQFIFGLIYSWGSISLAIHHQSGWAHSTLDIAFSLTPLSLLPAVILSGHWLQRVTPKTMLAWAMICFSLGSVIGVFASTSWLFIAGYSVLALGLGAGLSTSACIAIISSLYPEHRGKLGGGLLAVYGASSVLSVPIFNVLDGYISWRPAIGILLGSYAAFGWLCWFLLPTFPVASHQKSGRIAFKTLLSHRPLIWALCLVLAAAPFGSATFATIGRLAQEMGLSRTFVIAAVAMLALGNGLGRFAAGVLADMYSARISRNVVLGLNALAYAVFLIVSYSGVYGLFWSFPLLIGCAFGGLAGKLPSLAAHVFPEHPSSAFGLLFGTFAMGSFLGPLVSAEIGTNHAMQVLGLLAFLALPMGLIEKSPEKL